MVGPHQRVRVAQQQGLTVGHRGELVEVVAPPVGPDVGDPVTRSRSASDVIANLGRLLAIRPNRVPNAVLASGLR